MGNQPSHGHSHAPQAAAANHVPGEVLESFQKEKQRDDHLKNLGFKRSKSIRKSIAKRLKRKKRNPSSEDIKDGASKASKTSEASLDTRIEVVERPPDKPDKPIVGVPQPMPAHVQDLDNIEGAKPRKMDRLRRSFRASLKRKKDLTQSLDPTLNGGDPVVKCSAESSKQWQADEVAVRSGLCNFQVKYLGCVEVFNSRGMEVCEEAVKVLKNSKRKSVRSVLYVSGDGLRVVDDDTRGLILDQTIEKVSFCAPDRNYEKGFSYICRDGTTRRWMCHGFMAIKDSGERLSHAVGCAFAICLERKQKRDSECTVSVSFDSKNASFTRFGSFRQGTITERLQDPQVLKPAQPPPIPEKEENPFAIARPHAPDLMLQRQTSFRGFSHLQASGNSPFKRQLSLRLSDLPSTLERQRTSGYHLSNSIDPLGKDTYETEVRSMTMMPLDEVTEESEQAEANDINEMCQKLTVGLNMLSSQDKYHKQQSLVNGDHYKFQDQPRSMLSPRSGLSSSPLPPVPENHLLPSVPPRFTPHADLVASFPAPLAASPPLSASAILSTPTVTSTTSVKSTTGAPMNSLDAFLTSVKPMEYDNPWDWVPDQPLRTAFNASKASSSSTCDSTSSGISSGSLASIGGTTQRPNLQNTDTNVTHTSVTVKNGTDIFDNNHLPNGNNIDKSNSLFDVSDFVWSSDNHHQGHNSYHEELNSTAGILQDPFDAEWAALAMRNSVSKNPFVGDSESGLKKAFELQM